MDLMNFGLISADISKRALHCPRVNLISFKRRQLPCVPIASSTPIYVMNKGDVQRLGVERLEPPDDMEGFDVDMARGLRSIWV